MDACVLTCVRVTNPKATDAGEQDAQWQRLWDSVAEGRAGSLISGVAPGEGHRAEVGDLVPMAGTTPE